MNKPTPVLLTTAFLVLAATTRPLPAQERAPAPRVKAVTRWEYQSLNHDHLTKLANGGAVSVTLNRLGDDGWELVGVATLPVKSPSPGGGFAATPRRDGVAIDPERMWEILSQGKDSIDLKDRPDIRQRMEARGTPVPPNGLLTKKWYLEESKKRLAEREAKDDPVQTQGGVTYFFKRPKP